MGWVFRTNARGSRGQELLSGKIYTYPDAPGLKMGYVPINLS
jgi:hypothetical protein